VELLGGHRAPRRAQRSDDGLALFGPAIHGSKR
jgi:hypothetical protein